MNSFNKVKIKKYQIFENDDTQITSFNEKYKRKKNINTKKEKEKDTSSISIQQQYKQPDIFQPSNINQFKIEVDNEVLLKLRHKLQKRPNQTLTESQSVKNIIHDNQVESFKIKKFKEFLKNIPTDTNINNQIQTYQQTNQAAQNPIKRIQSYKPQRFQQYINQHNIKKLINNIQQVKQENKPVQVQNIEQIDNEDNKNIDKDIIEINIDQENKDQDQEITENEDNQENQIKDQENINNDNENDNSSQKSTEIENKIVTNYICNSNLKIQYQPNYETQYHQVYNKSPKCWFNQQKYNKSFHETIKKLNQQTISQSQIHSKLNNDKGVENKQIFNNVMPIYRKQKKYQKKNGCQTNTTNRFQYILNPGASDSPQKPLFTEVENLKVLKDLKFLNTKTSQQESYEAPKNKNPYLRNQFNKIFDLEKKIKQQIEEHNKLIYQIK